MQSDLAEPRQRIARPQADRDPTQAAGAEWRGNYLFETFERKKPPTNDVGGLNFIGRTLVNSPALPTQAQKLSPYGWRRYRPDLNWSKTQVYSLENVSSGLSDGRV